jgi:uncharacterized membrane protein YqaE (UPF0057 family)
MTDTDKRNLPGTKVYISKRHYRRKQKIEDSHKKKMKKEMENSGIIALIMMYIWDALVEIFVGFFFDLFDIAIYSFDYTYTSLFGNYNGILPNVEKYGMRFDYKVPRYIITLLLPPVGVLMGKGLFGWFNILICLIMCYVNYGLGIVYAFVITADNRYADRHERAEIQRIKELQFKYRTDEGVEEDAWALFGTFMFIALFVTISTVILSYF